MDKLKILIFIILMMFSYFSISKVDSLNEFINTYSIQQGVDPDLVRAIIFHESRGNIKATSSVGARGLMQVMPQTAQFVGVDPDLLYLPTHNIKAGIRYLSFLKKEFSGDIVKMVAGYNAGHGSVKKYKGIPPYKETIAYTRNVLKTYAKGGNPNFNIASFSKIDSKINKVKMNQEFVFILDENKKVSNNKIIFGSNQKNTFSSQEEEVVIHNPSFVQVRSQDGIYEAY